MGDGERLVGEVVGGWGSWWDGSLVGDGGWFVDGVVGGGWREISGWGSWWDGMLVGDGGSVEWWLE